MIARVGIVALHILAFQWIAAIAIVPSAHAGEAERVLWSSPAGAVIVRPPKRPVDMDDDALVMDVIRHGALVFTSRAGFLPKYAWILWERRQGVEGPDVIAAYDTGGNHCCLEVVLVDFAAPDPVKKITMTNTERPPVVGSDGSGRPELTIPFDIQGFNGPMAALSRASVPLRWNGSRMVADFDRLLRSPPSAEERQKLEQAMRAEMTGWPFDEYPPGPTAHAGAEVAVETVRIVLTLTLQGHADEARRLHARAWPERISGRDTYWKSLAGTITRHPLWREYDLGRIPNTDALYSVEGEQR